jgi:hypothetical protein
MHSVLDLDVVVVVAVAFHVSFFPMASLQHGIARLVAVMGDYNFSEKICPIFIISRQRVLQHLFNSLYR